MQSQLQDIGLVHYLPTIRDHGFESWQDLTRITESDLEQIGMLLGHRRKLQRAIRLSSTSEGPVHMLTTLNSKQQHQKRRYKRHPKRDPYTPKRPKSAYQSFADSVPRLTKNQNLTFVEHARLVGSRWASQSLAERDLWISAASKVKQEFHEQLQLYKDTEEYSHYQEYLQDFRKQHDPSDQVSRKSETEGDKEGVSEKKLLLPNDQREETKHCSAAPPFRAPNTIQKHETIPAACEACLIEDTNSSRPTTTEQLPRSRYFRTILRNCEHHPLESALE